MFCIAPDMIWIFFSLIAQSCITNADHMDTPTYIVFDPYQIKSATDNVGTFNPTYNDIRYREEESPATPNPSPVDHADSGHHTFDPLPFSIEVGYHRAYSDAVWIFHWALIVSKKMMSQGHDGAKGADIFAGICPFSVTRC